MCCRPRTPARRSSSTNRAMCPEPTRTRSRACWATRCRCGSLTSPRKVSSLACSEVEMGLLSLFRRAQPTANLAKERLRIIVAQERTTRGGPDYLPTLRRELLEVIRKYINVDPEAVQMNLEKEDGHEVLEFTVALPEKAKG